MRLVRIAKKVWEVVAIVDRAGGSVWSEVLAAASRGEAAAEDMKVLLQTEVPLNGPPKMNRHRCRDVGDGIYEFKGSGLRVLWFYDEGRRIVCSHYCGKLPNLKFQQVKGRASRARDRYMEAKKAGRLPRSKEEQAK